MKMTGPELISKVVGTRMVPVFNHDDKEVALNVLKACYEGGVRVFEFTNRSEKAAEVFEFLVSNRSAFPDLALGVGTIMNEDQCAKFISLGADFIVAPILDEQVAKCCTENQISWTPGCGTLTELIKAERLGASLIKVFPANVLGPDFIKAVLGPAAHLKLMPTGGVKPEATNLKTWFDAGVTCVGMGSQLFPADVLKQQDFNAVTEKCKEVLTVIDQLNPE